MFSNTRFIGYVFGTKTALKCVPLRIWGKWVLFFFTQTYQNNQQIILFLYCSEQAEVYRGLYT